MMIENDKDFLAARDAIDNGDLQALKQLLDANPDLTKVRASTNETLLIHLIDWPGHRPHAAAAAKLLLDSGAEVDAMRNAKNGTPLAGALCTEEPDVVAVLLEASADLHANLGWRTGTVLDLASELAENLSRKDVIVYR